MNIELKNYLQNEQMTRNSTQYEVHSELARALGVVTQQVRTWVTLKEVSVPARHCANIEKWTDGKVTKSMLRSDIFPENLSEITYPHSDDMTLDTYIRTMIKDNSTLTKARQLFADQVGVKLPTVIYWCKSDTVINEKHILGIEKATNGMCGRVFLRPDLYDY